MSVRRDYSGFSVGAKMSYMFRCEGLPSSSDGIAIAINFPSGEKHTLQPLPKVLIPVYVFSGFYCSDRHASPTAMFRLSHRQTTLSRPRVVNNCPDEW